MFKRILSVTLALLLFAAVLLTAVSCGADNTPTIGENGNWFIGGKDTGVPATGKNGKNGTDGKDGKDGLDGADGMDGINGTPGSAVTIGEDGFWYIDGVNTGVLATGGKETVKILPTPYIDLEFTGDGQIVDRMLHTTCAIQDPAKGKVETGELRFNGGTYALPHYRVRAAGGTATLSYNSLTKAQLTALLCGGFTMEALLVNYNAPAAAEQAMISSTQGGGFNFTRYGGKYTFSAHVGGEYRHGVLDAAYDTESLTHLVGVYDPSAQTVTLYVNGQKAGTETAKGVFQVAGGEAWRSIALGGDMVAGGTAGELFSKDLAIADFKLFPASVSEEDAVVMYAKTVFEISGRYPGYIPVYGSQKTEENGAVFASLTDSFARNLYEANTGLVSAPTVMQFADAAMLAGDLSGKRANTVIFGVTEKNGTLYATDKAGAELGTLYDAVKTIAGRCIPAFYFNDAALCNTMIAFLCENRIADCFIVSKEKTILKTVCDATWARPVPDLTGADFTPDSAMIAASAVGAKTVLTDAAALTAQNVLAMQARSLTVVGVLPAGADTATVHNTVFKGVNGLLTDNFHTVYGYYETITEKTLSRAPLIVGHRGDNENCPDNQLRSFISAAKSGATSIELDVYMTSDGYLVINHDTKTTGFDQVLDCTKSTRAQLEALVYTGNHAEEGDRIAFFDEVLEYFSQNDTQIVLTVEIKDARNKVVDKVVEMVRAAGMEGRVQLICMEHSIVRYAYQTHGVSVQMNRSYLAEKGVNAGLYLAAACMECASLKSAFFTTWTIADKAFADQLRHRGIKYSPWTSTGKDRTLDGISLEFPEFTTNNPHVPDKLVRRLRAEQSGDGTVKVFAVAYDGTETDVTASAVFKALSGDVTFTNGKVSGSGSFTFSYRRSFTFDKTKTYTYDVYTFVLTK